MRNDYERMFYLPGGPLAAIVLGMALVPLRESTNSANFIFAFMVLIIVVAEFGGRWASLATATCSALSLDFFLTQPYLSLRIEGKHDLIAFAGLTICGLVAAALGSRRGDAVASLREARTHLDLLHDVLSHLEAGGPLEGRLEEVLHDCREALPLAGLVIRNSRGDVIAASGRAPEPRPGPGISIPFDSLLPPGGAASELPRCGMLLPIEGAKLALGPGGGQVGWLELWGDGTTASPMVRRTLSNVARLIASVIGGELAKS